MSRTVGFKCELLSPDYSKKTDIVMLPGGSVKQQALATMKRTATFTIEEHPAIEWERDLFRLSAHTEGIRYPLGIFIPSSPSRQKTGKSFKRTVSAYDISKVLLDDRLTDRYIYRAGQPYTEAIGDTIQSAGIFRHEIDISSEVFATDREYEIGTPLITIINELLSEISFNSLYANNNGVLIGRKYTPPNERATTHVYIADDKSIIHSGLSTSLDFFDIPNVFIATYSSPEAESMTAMFTNDDPDSLLSTIRRNREIVAEPRLVKEIPSKAALQAYVERWAMETSQVFESVSFETAINPVHETNDMIELQHPDVGMARFVETVWELPLEAGRPMKHEARRVITL